MCRTSSSFLPLKFGWWPGRCRWGWRAPSTSIRAWPSSLATIHVCSSPTGTFHHGDMEDDRDSPGGSLNDPPPASSSLPCSVWKLICGVNRRCSGGICLRLAEGVCTPASGSARSSFWQPLPTSCSRPAPWNTVD